MQKSKFRLLCEKIRKNILRPEEAFLANNFATPIITEFLNKLPNFFKYLLDTKQLVLDLEIHNIIFHISILPVKESFGAYSPTDHTITLILNNPYLLIEDEILDDLLRHELLHYYHAVIQNYKIKRTYSSGDIYNIKYTKNSEELRTYYQAMCNYIYKSYLELAKLQNNIKNYKLSDIVSSIWYGMCNYSTYPFYTILNTYTKEEQNQIFDALLKYMILKVGEKND